LKGLGAGVRRDNAEQNHSEQKWFIDPVFHPSCISGLGKNRRAGKREPDEWLRFTMAELGGLDKAKEQVVLRQGVSLAALIATPRACT